jgi:hypothetical protein
LDDPIVAEDGGDEKVTSEGDSTPGDDKEEKRRTAQHRLAAERKLGISGHHLRVGVQIPHQPKPKR